MSSEYIIHYSPTTVTGGWTNPGTGWGGDPIDADNNPTIMAVYAWDRDPAVTFSTINQTVEVDPRSYSEDTAGAQQAADDFTAEVTALQGAGFKGAFRYWKEDVIAFGNTLDGNWWETIDAYDSLPVDATMQSWWADFNARVVSNGVTPDYKIHDFENGVGYYQLPSEDVRKTHFESITIDNASNPYPNSPNPYIGSEIWKYSDPLTDQFIQEYNQSAAERLDTFLKVISNACPVVSGKYSNYNDYIESYPIGNLSGRPNRDPDAQVRMASTASPPIYLDYDVGESLTNPEPEYTTARQAVNRRRWKKMIWRLNRARTSLAAGSRVDPWIAPPGYGADGADTWASSNILPFEKLLWRVKIRHLRAVGIDTFILWNPVSDNPNSADTDAFMDAYFTDLYTRDINSTVGLIPMSSESIVTNDRVTQYDDVYRIRTLYWQKNGSAIEPFSQGFGTPTEPLILNPGTTGDDELAAFLAALEIVYGDATTGGYDAYSVPLDFQVSGLIPAPE